MRDRQVSLSGAEHSSGILRASVMHRNTRLQIKISTLNSEALEVLIEGPPLLEAPIWKQARLATEDYGLLGLRKWVQQAST